MELEKMNHVFDRFEYRNLVRIENYSRKRGKCSAVALAMTPSFESTFSKEGIPIEDMYLID